MQRAPGKEHVMTEAVIGDINHEKVGSTSRIVSQFDGEPVWFESDDIELEPSIEAFATLWLMPCILANRNLRFEKPVCKIWYENAVEYIDFHADRWGTAKIKIFAETYETSVAPQQGEAVCFSGGVDSFHTLMNVGSPKYLVRAEPADPSSRLVEDYRLSRERIAKVANGVGAIPVTIKFNVIEHPSYRIHDDNDGYTGTLACMGHLLSPHIGSIFISSSHHKDDPAVLGCRWQTDPLFSTTRLQVHHTYVDFRRRDKVAAIADWHLAQENLFVCFEKLGSNRNCSRCEKCIRTMLDLYLLGKLELFKNFDQSKPLWEAMDHVQVVHNSATYHAALAESLDPRVANGIWRMLRREHERVWRLEEADNKLRYLDEELAGMKEGLQNVLHHYSLLQEEHQRLAADYAAIAGSLPIRNGLKLVRKVAKKLRGNGAKQGARHD